MPELLGCLVVATGFLFLVIRDALIAHGVVVRALERTRDGDGSAGGDGSADGNDTQRPPGACA